MRWYTQPFIQNYEDCAQENSNFANWFNFVMSTSFDRNNDMKKPQIVVTKLEILNRFLYSRISVIFRVRSAKAVKITDAGNWTLSLSTSPKKKLSLEMFSIFLLFIRFTYLAQQKKTNISFTSFSCINLFSALLKRLGVLCGCISVALLIRTIVAPPVVVVGRTADDLKAFLCKTNWWDHTFTSSKFNLFFPFIFPLACILKRNINFGSVCRCKFPDDAKKKFCSVN